MEEFEPAGPVSYLVVEFPGSRMTGEGFPILVDLAERGLINILDLVFLTKDAEGTMHRLELRQLPGGGDVNLAVFDEGSSGLLEEDDLADACSVLDEGSSAAVLLFENLWAADFVGALRRSGGELVAAGYVPRDALVITADGTGA